MWIPLALCAYHRAVDEGSWRFGLLGGIFVWLQILTSVYYGVFLAITVALFVPMLMAMHPRRGLAALPGLAAGILVALILTLPYALPYLKNAQRRSARARAMRSPHTARGRWIILPARRRTGCGDGPLGGAGPNETCSPAPSLSSWLRRLSRTGRAVW